MKVSSPVGEFPFAISRVEVTRDGITVRGLMGAWPARVEVGLSDLPQMARAMRVPLLIGGLGVTWLVARGLRGR